MRAGQQRYSGCKGVIYGVPLTVNMGELVENLRVRNSSMKSVNRITRGGEKRETETVLVEFEGKVFPKELCFGLLEDTM